MIFRAIKYQPISFVFTSAGQTVSCSNITTDRNYKKVVGIKARTNDLTAMGGLTIGKFEINGQEIYPSDLDVADLSSSESVSPNERYDKDVDEPAEGSTVNISLTDGSIAGQAFPYKVKVTLKLNNPVK